VTGAELKTAVCVYDCHLWSLLVTHTHTLAQLLCFWWQWCFSSGSSGSWWSWSSLWCSTTQTTHTRPGERALLYLSEDSLTSGSFCDCDWVFLMEIYIIIIVAFDFFLNLIYSTTYKHARGDSYTFKYNCWG